MADVVGTLRVVLEADAAEFDRAMKEASADVRELADKLQKDLAPRQRAVNAAVRDFLGSNEIRRAQEYAKAIDRIGDVSKLTAADQLKVNRAVSEALAHYKALGIQAPQNLMAIQKATSGAASSFAGMSSTLKGFAATLGVTFSIGALTSFAAKVFSAASDIDDMSKKLGVSAEAAQRFKFAAEQTGASIADVEKAISFMNRTLAEGDKSTVKALEQAGLNFADIRAMKPEDAFRTIADAVGQIEDPMTRAQVAQELFGRGALELLPGMIEGYTKLGEGVTVMSNETVKRLADAEDAWTAFGNKVTIITGEILADIMGGDGKSSINALVAGMAGASMASEKFAEKAKLISPAMAEMNQNTRKAAGGTKELTEEQKKGIASADAYRKKIQAIADQLTGKKLAQDVKELADAVKMAGGEGKITGQELTTLAERLDKVAARGGKLTPELQAIRDKFLFFRDMVKSTRIEVELFNKTLAFQQFNRDDEIARRRQGFNDMAARGPLPGTMNVSFQNQANLKQLDLADKKTEDWAKSLEDVVDAFEDLASIAGDTMSDVTRGIGSGIASVRLFDDGIKKLSDPGNFAGMLTGLTSIIGALTSAVQLGKALGDALTRSEGEKAAADIRRNFDLNITEDDAIAKQIEQMVKDLGIDRNLAIDLALPDIARGKIDTGNFEEFRNRTAELFDDIRLGGEVGEMALTSLDDMLGQLGEHVIEQGGIWDAEFVGMLKRAQAEGLELASVMKLVKGQLDLAAGGLNQAVSGQKPTDQGEFDRLSRLSLATFNAFIANGQNAADAIAAIAPSIDALKQSAQDLGFAGNDAFNQLVRWRDLVSANQPLLDQIGGLNQLMMALANVGALDTQTFADMQAQGLDTFQSLTAAGFTQQEALQQMKPMLETIIKLHAERGLAIDDETQKLIDQAREQGILQDEQLDTNEILMQGIGALIEALGGKLPPEWEKLKRDAKSAAQTVENEFNDIEIDIPVNFDVENQPRIDGDWSDYFPGAATGAFVKKRPGGTLVNVGEGAHDEFIIPEPDLRDLIDGWNAGPSLPSLSMGSSLAGVQAAGGDSAVATGTPVYLTIDGRVFGELMLPTMLETSQRLGITRV